MLAAVMLMASDIFVSGPPASAASPGAALYSWGIDNDGALGNGGSASSNVPGLVSLPAGVSATAVASGPQGYSAYALGSDGNVYAWGDNTYGQLGDGTSSGRSLVPVVVSMPAGVKATAIAADGGTSAYAIGSDGNLYAWGYNGFGELGNGTTGNSDVPVAVSLPAGVTPEAVTAGNFDALAIGSDGNLYAWGDNRDGQLGNGTTTDSDVPVQVSLPAGVSATAIAGQYAIGSDGNIYAWGVGEQGQLGNGTVGSDICSPDVNCQTIPVQVSMPAGVTATAVAGSTYDGYAVGSDGQVYSWGRGTYGALGLGSTGNAICGPFSYNCQLTPAVVPLPSGVSASAVAAGTLAGYAVGSDGHEYAWGYDFDGALGNGQNGAGSNAFSPVQVSWSAGIEPTSIAAGDDTSYAIAGPAATKPSPPSGATAVAGVGQATVSFSPPSSDGGSSVTSYTVTASDDTNPANGGQTLSGPGSPLTMTGLTGGDAYTFTVTATNAAGTSDPSDPSNVVTVGQVPAITSAASASTPMREPFSFTITTTGIPAPAVSETGALPAGITSTDNGDGTATLAGTATPGTAGNYPLTITADNGDGDPATQAFTLTVTTAASSPAITSGASDTETFGAPFSYAITTTGYPVPKITKSGPLPSGVTFTNNGDGTATIAGSPTRSAVGSYDLTLTASSNAGTVVQDFKLTITKAPVIKKIPATTAHVGTPLTLTITSTGDDTPALTEQGILPAGLIFTDNGNGTATITGTPGAGSGGAYPLTITATNSLGTATQNYTLKVDENPVITSADDAAGAVGSALSIPVTATGYPAPKITITGTLPAGVTFKAGTATFAGTLKPGTAGTYAIAITATNTSGATTQNFTLTIS
jgi:alpha-tubulin suppressor-like RCC1 family protein